MTISLAAGDATNLALRLLKVVDEVLGKPKPGSTGSNKMWSACTHNHWLAGMQIADPKFLEVTLQVGAGGRPPRGDNPTQTPKATGQRGEDCDNYRPLRVSNCFWMEKRKNE